MEPLGFPGEPDLERFGALPDEADETLPLLRQGIALSLEQWFERLDEQGGAALALEGKL